MSNRYLRFQNLFKKTTKVVGTIVSHNADGTSTLLLPDGNNLKAVGQIVGIGLKAYVIDGVVVSSAPTLPIYTYEV